MFPDEEWYESIQEKLKNKENNNNNQQFDNEQEID